MLFQWIAGDSSAKKMQMQKKGKCEGFLWNGLSKDIQMAILARVPLKQFARCRVVCKEWDSLWHSRSFISCRSRSPAEQPWFLFNQVSDDDDDAQELAMSLGQHCSFSALNSLCYSPAVNEWLRLSFDDFLLPLDVDRVVATARGLLLCVDKPTVFSVGRNFSVSYVWSTMIVCNPFGSCNNHHRLPPRLWSWKPNVIAMFADPPPATNASSAAVDFKIVLVVAGEGLEVYDSREQAWKLVTSFDPPGQLSFVHGTVVHKHWMHFLDGNTLVSFDVEKEFWIGTELPTEDLKHTQVYICEGRLFLVGCTGCGNADESARLSVWELVGNGDSTPGDESDEWWELSCVLIENVSVAFSAEMASGYGAEDLLMVRGSRMLRRDLMHLNRSRLQGNEDESPNLVEQVNDFLYSISRNAWYMVLESFGYIDRLSEYDGKALRFEPMMQAYV